MKRTSLGEGRPVEGLRARKQRQTRERITSSAMSLFLKRGFDAVTVDEIATAADISRRTFFDYFETKEEVVSSWQDEFARALTAAVLSQPTSESVPVVVEEAMVLAIASFSSPERIAVDRLIRDTPALQAREPSKYLRLEQSLAEALENRAHSEEGRFRARLLAMIVIGALRLLSDARHKARGVQPALSEPYVRKVFRTVWSDLREFADAAMRRTLRRPK